MQECDIFLSYRDNLVDRDADIHKPRVVVVMKVNLLHRAKGRDIVAHLAHKVCVISVLVYIIHHLLVVQTSTIMVGEGTKLQFLLATQNLLRPLTLIIRFRHSTGSVSGQSGYFAMNS